MASRLCALPVMPMPTDPVPSFMNAPGYLQAWAGVENPNANDASEMMPALMVFNVFMGLGLWFVWKLCKKNRVPFWEVMIALWCVLQVFVFCSISLGSGSMPALTSSSRSDCRDLTTNCISLPAALLPAPEHVWSHCLAGKVPCASLYASLFLPE